MLYLSCFVGKFEDMPYFNTGFETLKSSLEYSSSKENKNLLSLNNKKQFSIEKFCSDKIFSALFISFKTLSIAHCFSYSASSFATIFSALNCSRSSRASSLSIHLF